MLTTVPILVQICGKQRKVMIILATVHIFGFSANVRSTSKDLSLECSHLDKAPNVYILTCFTSVSTNATIFLKCDEKFCKYYIFFCVALTYNSKYLNILFQYLLFE